jgi:hypothetical protein
VFAASQQNDAGAGRRDCAAHARGPLRGIDRPTARQLGGRLLPVLQLQLETKAQAFGHDVQRVADLTFCLLSFLRQRAQAETRQDHAGRENRRRKDQQQPPGRAGLAAPRHVAWHRSALVGPPIISCVRWL